MLIYSAHDVVAATVLQDKNGQSLKRMYSSLWKTHHGATKRYLPYEITTCHQTQVNASTCPILTKARQANIGFTNTYPEGMEG